MARSASRPPANPGGWEPLGVNSRPPSPALGSQGLAGCPGDCSAHPVRRLLGASGARKLGMVASSRFGLLRKATGHSVTRSSLTWIYCPGSVDELALQDKGNRLLRALCICGDLCGLLIAGKWLVGRFN